MARLALSCGLLSSWLALLLLGWSFGGAVHLLLVAALAVFPWRLLRSTPEAVAGSPAEGALEGHRDAGQSPPPR